MKIHLGHMLLLITLLSCSSSETGKNDIIRLHDIWALESIDGQKIEINESLRQLPMIEIYVKDERIHGNTSCNTLDGKVKISENKISFSDIITTEIACPGDLEEKFLSALTEVNNYKIEKLKLHLFRDNKELLIFQKID